MVIVEAFPDRSDNVKGNVMLKHGLCTEKIREVNLAGTRVYKAFFNVNLIITNPSFMEVSDIFLEHESSRH